MNLVNFVQEGQTLGVSLKMGQDISVSYQAVKGKVYKLIDSLVEGSKTPAEVQVSIQRWWGLIHPADRAVAQKYLVAILQKSNSSLSAMCDGLAGLKEFEGTFDTYQDTPPKAHAANGHGATSRPV